VLIVEDSEADAWLIQTLLAETTEMAFEFASVDRLAPALARLERETFDLVILDLALPDSRGLETFTRACERAPGVPIVVLTGSDDRALAVAALRAGAQDYVVKGDVDGRRLGQLLRHAIERKRVEEALRRQTETVQAISRAMARVLEAGDWPGAMATLLPVAAQATESGLGLAAVLLDGAELRLLGHWAGAGLGLGAAALDATARRAYTGQGYLDLPADPGSLLTRVVTSGQPLAQAQPREPQLEALAAGFPALGSVLALPVRRGAEVVGVLALAERRGGYAVEDAARLDDLLPVFGALFHDYRQRHRHAALEEQLRQAHKMEAVGRLAGGIAHDFNNLLAVILGYSEFMVKSLPASHPLHGDAEEIKTATERAASLTRQLLAFSRKQVIAPRPLDLNAVVRGGLRMLQRVIGEDIELVTRLDPDVRPVKADPGQLEQVLLNLAANARDAMPQGGQLSIETARIGGPARLGPGEELALLTVTDTGCGMDRETCSHAFEPFFTTKEPGRGTGLGLATVYGIVEQHGGHIEVQSAPGRGATFRVYLPCVDGPVEGGDGAGAAVAPRGSETVLLVEDEVGLRALGRRILQRLGYTVLEAGDGRAALRLAQRHRGPIDLLLTDVILPQMTGVELARQLSALRPGMRLLFVSGYPGDALGRHGVAEAGGRVLSKPFSPALLGRTVRDVLDAAAPGVPPAAQRPG
jgi:signal transduction histidine kinase/DNA-binding response OmpR family regulator